jgi:tetratricopeptide (TPR) repeat protein
MRTLLSLGALLVCAGVLSAAGQGVLTSDASFAELLNEYRAGDARRAVDVLSTWDEDRLEREASVPDDDGALVSRAATALLLTEAGMASRRFGRPAKGASRFFEPTGWGLQKSFEVHAYRAHALIDALATEAAERHDVEFLAWAKSWYILSSSYCLEFQLACTEGLLEKGLHHAREDDPEVMLWRGSIREPRIRTREVFTHQMSASVTYGQEARHWFRKALEARPSLVEARVRLGRSLFVTQNDPAAERYLVEALEQADAERHVFAGYIAALTLGEMAEAVGRLADAVPQYRRAITFVPGHTAHVALGLALVQLGQRDEGWQQGRVMFGTRGPGTESVLDPFAVYLSAQYWQSASRLAEMRKAVRVDGR